MITEQHRLRARDVVRQEVVGRLEGRIPPAELEAFLNEHCDSIITKQAEAYADEDAAAAEAAERARIPRTDSERVTYISKHGAEAYRELMQRTDFGRRELPAEGAPLRRSGMSITEKARYISEHGGEEYRQLPW